ncbi:hypothetical protein UG55_10912 [Frankia sp. EI5c]|nr:hypothetical protein UG55_10912 [Frankia sp. EI5c]
MDVTVKVPEERLPDFYAMYGRWLAGQDAQPDEEQPTEPIEWSEQDLVLAKIVWGKFSDRAKAMFSTLIDSPGKKFGGVQLADALDIPNGKYGTAGVLAWPARHCTAVDRLLPCKYEDGVLGDGANYWMTPAVATLFKQARDGQ